MGAEESTLSWTVGAPAEEGATEQRRADVESELGKLELLIGGAWFENAQTSFGLGDALDKLQDYLSDQHCTLWKKGLVYKVAIQHPSFFRTLVSLQEGSRIDLQLKSSRLLATLLIGTRPLDWTAETFAPYGTRAPDPRFARQLEAMDSILFEEKYP